MFSSRSGDTLSKFTYSDSRFTFPNYFSHLYFRLLAENYSAVLVNHLGNIMQLIPCKICGIQGFLSSCITCSNFLLHARHISDINFVSLQNLAGQSHTSNLSVSRAALPYTADVPCNEGITCSGLPFISTFTEVMWLLLNMIHRETMNLCSLPDTILRKPKKPTLPPILPPVP